MTTVNQYSYHDFFKMTAVNDKQSQTLTIRPRFSLQSYIRPVNTSYFKMSAYRRAYPSTVLYMYLVLGLAELKLDLWKTLWLNRRNVKSCFLDASLWAGFWNSDSCCSPHCINLPHVFEQIMVIPVAGADFPNILFPSTQLSIIKHG